MLEKRLRQAKVVSWQRFILSLLALSISNWISAGEIVVHTDFPGGSARVETIDQESRTIRFFPAGDPLRGWPCWWYLRVDGAPIGKTITFELGGSPLVADQGPTKGRRLNANWAMADQAAVSFDNQNWEHTAPGKRRDDRMIYEVTASKSTLWLAWGPPFTPEHSAALLARLADQHDFVDVKELCKSREGRSVPALFIGEPNADQSERFGVWVHARQHAWEAGASWVANGFAEWLVDSNPEAQWLRKNADVVLVPVMDVDHVATGDGGKEAMPQDHNRDWSDAPHWPEVAAAQKHLRRWSTEGRMDLFVDLHNPSYNDRQAFFYLGPEDLLTDIGRRNRNRFLNWAQREITGPIPLAKQPKPSGPGYHPLWKQISGNWVVAHGNPHTVSVCLETAWNTPHSVQENYVRVGEQLGRAIVGYLREHPRK